MQQKRGSRCGECCAQLGGKDGAGEVGGAGASLARPVHFVCCSQLLPRSPKLGIQTSTNIHSPPTPPGHIRREALQTGLEASGSKRKQPEGGSGGGGGGKPAAKKGMLDSMLGDISSSDDEEDEEDE